MFFSIVQLGVSLWPLIEIIFISTGTSNLNSTSLQQTHFPNCPSAIELEFGHSFSVLFSPASKKMFKA